MQQIKLYRDLTERYLTEIRKT